LKQATLCYVVDGSKVLLGLKKVRFGAGKWNGFGGKVESSETPEVAAVRELKEEVGLIANGLKKSAEITFLFPHKPEWDQVVHVFVAKNWSGVPKESEEMKPDWFDVSKLPLASMWSTDVDWLPNVLAGKFVKGSVVFSPELTALKKELSLL
jgi:8-oxo-dGTP diphosphatase